MLLSLPSKLVFAMAKQIHKVILEVLVRIFFGPQKEFSQEYYTKN